LLWFETKAGEKRYEEKMKQLLGRSCHHVAALGLLAFLLALLLGLAAESSDASQSYIVEADCGLIEVS